MKKLFLGLVLAFISTFIYAQTQQAFIAPGELRTFLDYNLGADTSLPSTTPSLGIKGDKFQWGLSTKISATTDWNAAPAPDTALSDDVKTSNDPCPSGYRIPTGAEWQGVISNNSVQWIGNFYEDGWGAYNRHTSGLLINNSLFLPAAGSINVGGTIASNNASGVYWSTTSLGYLNYVSALVFYWAGQMPSTSKSIQVNPLYKPRGGNVRCIKETSIVPLMLSVQESKIEKDFTVYPNPATNSFQVKGNGDKNVQVYDTFGRLVLQTNAKPDTIISTKDLLAGNYVVKVVQGNKTISSKLVIK